VPCWLVLRLEAPGAWSRCLLTWSRLLGSLGEGFMRALVLPGHTALVSSQWVEYHFVSCWFSCTSFLLCCFCCQCISGLMHCCQCIISHLFVFFSFFQVWIGCHWWWFCWGGVKVDFVVAWIDLVAIGDLCHNGIRSVGVWVVFVCFLAILACSFLLPVVVPMSVGILGAKVCLNSWCGCRFSHFWLHHSHHYCYGVVAVGCTLSPIVILSTSFSFIDL